MQPSNPIMSALLLSHVVAAMNAEAAERLLYDVHTDPHQARAFAAGDNILFDVVDVSAEEEASAVLGTREIWIGPLNAQGICPADDFMLLSKLRAGDTGPTPEAVTEDTTFDNGTVVSNQTGVNNGSKTWEIEGSADAAAISMLIDHCRIPGFGTPEKRGKNFAYIAYAEDRSSLYGTAKVNTAAPLREGSQRWGFNIPFVTVGLRRPAQNPIAGGAGVPGVADVSPDSGAIGQVVTITGANLNNVTEARFGPAEIDTFTTQTSGVLTFAVPAGSTPGTKAVVLVYEDGELSAGTFEVTA